MLPARRVPSLWRRTNHFSSAASRFSSSLPATKPSLLALIRSYTRPTSLQQIHALLLTTGLSRKNSFLTQILLSMASSGHMIYACHLFDDMHKPRVFLWNTLLRGYANHGLPSDALALFRRMHRLGVRPDSFTFPFVLRACADLLDAWFGCALHSLLFKYGLSLHAIVATELMIMYAKLGAAESAQEAFVEMGSRKDLIAWNALINAFAQNGHADKALIIFRRMESVGVNPDSVTLVGVVNSYAYLGCLELGKKLHMRIKKGMIESNVIVENALLDMYAKCGSMEEAEKLFDEMHQKNVVSWSTMIGGYAVNGDSRRALTLYSLMRKEGVTPNHVTHLAFLSACCHAGLVDEGKKHFNSLSDPKLEHYASMVDLLGRSGHLEEAYSFIKSMPIVPDSAVWGALLGACTVYKSLELGQIAADEVLRIAPSIPSYHVLLSNIYATSGRWKDVENIRDIMRVNEVKKIAGYSSMELEGEIYIFHEGSHAHSKDLYKKLNELTLLLMNMGYTLMTGVVLHDVEIEEKEESVRTHSEKLALAFGLIRSEGSDSPLRIMKNLRVCYDCHTFFKYVSKALGREIIMRDKNRFHHFRNCECSCMDFW